jgi:hypothetical protein
MKKPDRLRGLGLVAELDEGEPSRAAGLTIGGQVDLDDAPGLGQQLREGVRRGSQVQISDEYSGWNGSSPPSSIGWVVGPGRPPSGPIGQ